MQFSQRSYPDVYYYRLFKLLVLLTANAGTELLQVIVHDEIGGSEASGAAAARGVTAAASDRQKTSRYSITQN